MTRKLLLTFATDSKINLIKIIRETTGMGLKEAKDAIEQGMLVDPNQLIHFLPEIESRVNAENDRRRRECNPGTALIMFNTLIATYNPKPAPVTLDGFNW